MSTNPGKTHYGKSAAQRDSVVVTDVCVPVTKPWLTPHRTHGDAGVRQTQSSGRCKACSQSSPGLGGGRRGCCGWNHCFQRQPGSGRGFARGLCRRRSLNSNSAISYPGLFLGPLKSVSLSSFLRKMGKKRKESACDFPAKTPGESREGVCVESAGTNFPGSIRGRHSNRNTAFLFSSY